MAYEQLRLENQICFPIYVISRLFTREYQPYLDELGITYPQYLALMVLWEKDRLMVSEIADKLLLNTNTITPLLKRMETQGLIERQRSSEDERKVIVCLTEKGKKLQEPASKVPELFISGLVSEAINVDDLKNFRDRLSLLIDHMVSHGSADLP